MGSLSPAPLQGTSSEFSRATGYYYGFPEGQASVTNGAAMTLNRLYFVPARLGDVSLDRIGMRFPSGVPTAVVRVGVYADSAGLPGALLLEAAGTLDGATAGNDEEIIDLAVDGLVWLAAVTQTAAATVYAQDGVGQGVGSSSLFTSVAGSPIAYYQESVSGALPASATVAGTASQVPRIAVRVA